MLLDAGNLLVGSPAGTHEARLPVPLVCLFVLADGCPSQGREPFSILPSGWAKAGSDRIQMRQRSWYVANDGWLEQAFLTTKWWSYGESW